MAWSWVQLRAAVYIHSFTLLMLCYAVLCCAVPPQVSEVSRLQSQLQSADGQKLQLEQQMAAFTQQMTSAMASLGQFMQQQQVRRLGRVGGGRESCSRASAMQ